MLYGCSSASQIPQLNAGPILSTENSNYEEIKECKLYPAVSEGKWGYIDTSGQFAIQPQYEEVCLFNKYGIALVITGDILTICYDPYEVTSGAAGLVEVRYDLNSINMLINHKSNFWKQLEC